MTCMDHSSRSGSLLICIRWWISSSLAALQLVNMLGGGGVSARTPRWVLYNFNKGWLCLLTILQCMHLQHESYLNRSLLTRLPTLDMKPQFGRLLVNPLSPGLSSVVGKQRHFAVISSFSLLYSEQRAAGIAQVDVSALSVKAVMSPQAAS